jgi:hypothetical protein
MRRIAMSFAIVAAMAVVLRAQTVPPPCKSGTLLEYMELPPVEDSGGCTIGQAIFSDFALSFIVPNAEGIDPSNIRITPVNDSRGPGLEFTVNLSARSGRVVESAIAFTVSGVRFTRNTLSTTGATAAGDGAVAVVEDNCLGDFSFLGQCFIPTTAHAISAVISADEVPADPLSFEPVELIGVSIDMITDGGSNGQAALVSSRVQFQ